MVTGGSSVLDFLACTVSLEGTLHKKSVLHKKREVYTKSLRNLR